MVIDKMRFTSKNCEVIYEKRNKILFVIIKQNRPLNQITAAELIQEIFFDLEYILNWKNQEIKDKIDYITISLESSEGKELEFLYLTEKYDYFDVIRMIPSKISNLLLIENKNVIIPLDEFLEFFSKITQVKG